MATRSCTDKVNCLRVTIIPVFTRIRRINLARYKLGGIYQTIRIIIIYVI